MLNSHDTAVADALNNISSGMERMMAGLNELKSLLIRADRNPLSELDPKDPANKHNVGGMMKFTERGEELCYRMFDAGMSRYAVAAQMDISFGAATHRYEAWQKLGGPERFKKPLMGADGSFF